MLSAGCSFDLFVQRNIGFIKFCFRFWANIFVYGFDISRSISCIQFFKVWGQQLKDNQQTRVFLKVGHYHNGVCQIITIVI